MFVEEDAGREVAHLAEPPPVGGRFLGPLYLLPDKPEVCFSYDGNSLVPLSGQPEGGDDGIKRAHALLRAAARNLPDNVERRRMM